MKDIIIIGAGVVGASIARELSKYNLDVLILEKNNEVANEQSKANTAIVHSGYDPEPNTLMAKLNVKGNAMFPELQKELGFPYINTGSLIVALNEKEIEKLKELYERGVKNKVPGLKILSRDEVLKIEKNISDDVVAALYTPTGGIVSPWQLTENLVEVAVDNGVKLHLSEKVIDIKKEDEIFKVVTDKDTYNSKLVINAAGVYSDVIHNLVCEKDFTINPVRGEYVVYNHFEGAKITPTIFRLPNEKGKGILVTKTAHGHLIIGPTADPVESKDNKATTPNTFDYLIKKASESVKNIDFKLPLREYSGIRANSTASDFVIRETEVKGFIDVACIKSPGLTSAPAIALMVIDIIKNTNRVEFTLNESFNKYRNKQKVLYTYPNDERDKVIKDDSDFGEYIDRHESITTGDILNIIRRNAGATTLNGVKRRTRCGASESQMVFTMPRVLEILKDELNIPYEKINLDDNGSYVLTRKASLDNKEIHFNNRKLDFNELKDEYDTIIIGASIDGLKYANELNDSSVLVVDLLDEIGGSIYEMLKFETSLNEVNLDIINNLVNDKVNYLLNTALFTLDKDNKIADLINKKGYKRVKYNKLVLATGSYEANRENLYIPGTRPSGIFTAMQAIRILNHNKYLFGENVVIYKNSNEAKLLSKRLEKEGVKVTFLDENSKITEIKGDYRIEKIVVDGSKEVELDTLILTGTYIPDNVLTKTIGLNLDKDDYVIVDKNNATNIKDIYAVGTIKR